MHCEVIVMLRQFWMKVTNEYIVHIGLVWLHKEEASKRLPISFILTQTKTNISPMVRRTIRRCVETNKLKASILTKDVFFNV